MKKPPKKAKNVTEKDAIKNWQKLLSDVNKWEAKGCPVMSQKEHAKLYGR